MGGVQDRTEGVMAEYYSGEAVIDFIRSYRHSTDVAFHMEKHINEIPAADVRPVVLCRDCKYAPIGDKDGSDLEWPFNEFDKNGLFPPFCWPVDIVIIAYRPPWAGRLCLY